MLKLENEQLHKISNQERHLTNRVLEENLKLRRDLDSLNSELTKKISDSKKKIFHDTRK
jgi:hypothetical protein